MRGIRLSRDAFIGKRDVRAIIELRAAGFAVYGARAIALGWFNPGINLCRSCAVCINTLLSLHCRARHIHKETALLNHSAQGEYRARHNTLCALCAIRIALDFGVDFSCNYFPFAKFSAPKLDWRNLCAVHAISSNFDISPSPFMQYYKLIRIRLEIWLKCLQI